MTAHQITGRRDRERRALQACVAIGALLPVSAGLAGAILGTRSVETAANVSADSHFRYLSGLLLAIGLAYWSTIPAIEAKTAQVRLLTLIVFVGGLGRLLGLVIMGAPSVGMIGGLVMELVVTPALCLWQSRIARMRLAGSGRNLG
jgi:Domain of unknown function (DUF4345)